MTIFQLCETIPVITNNIPSMQTKIIGTYLYANKASIERDKLSKENPERNLSFNFITVDESWS